MACKPQKRPWLEWLPFGIGAKKPRHFRDMGRILWQNRDSLPRAWRVLTRGVCDGCALGTTGLKDWTVKGTHLCMVRLELLRLNTMGALKGEVWRDVPKLKLMTSRELRELGRIPYPLRRRKGEAGFSRVSWDEAMAGIGEHWKKTDPLKAAMFVTSRGVTNEVYYAAQKVSRFLGSPHVDNSARLCHSPSTAGLKRTVGIAATTCSYLDWYEADVIIFIGSNPANDQPVSTKYLAEAKRRGARILEVNAFREPGMKRYWVPSDARSAVFGTDIVDRSFQVKVGGDLAFFCAVQKNLLAHGGSLAEQFIEESTQEFKEFKDALMELEEPALLQQAGVTSEEVEDFAEEVRRAGNGVLVWSMGVTQHVHGADTVASIANLGLLKGWMGRNGCGLMPIRGHSGVQGGAEMGAYATALPGGLPITAETAQQFSELWGFQVPPQEGWSCVESLEQAQQGNLDAFWCIGGNFLETMPRPERIQKGLENINIRVHTDLFLTNQMLAEPGEVVYVLPARTRYEQEDGGTETSTERRVIFSPEIPRNDLPEAESEWRMLRNLAFAVRGDEAASLGLDSGPAIRKDIAAAVPSYAGIEHLSKQGDQFQWGGRHLLEHGVFPFPNQRARFAKVCPPLDEDVAAGTGEFLLATRRGKQFNSMVQAERDPITGADRNHLFIAESDMARLGLRPNQDLLITSPYGTIHGRAFEAEVAPGTVQAHWPEVNPLLPHDRVDRGGGVPDYNVRVDIQAR